MAKIRYANNYNPLFPSARNPAVYGKKVYTYRSDGTLSGVAKRAAYLPKKAYNAYKQTRKGKNYGKFDFDVE